jgi:hypothetical protein
LPPGAPLDARERLSQVDEFVRTRLHAFLSEEAG